MGGDGGTLNNTRREHTSRKHPTETAVHKRARASVTHCAASKQPLIPPVVTDRLGNLYNKDALLSCLLARIRDPSTSQAFAHIKSLKKHTAAVRFATSKGAFVCPVTRKVVTEEGRFTVGWECGCVVADSAALGVRESDGQRDGSEEGFGVVTCVACDLPGERVRLGMMLEERDRVRERLEKERELRRSKKRKRVEAACDNAVEQKAPRVAEEPVK